ncbi:MAG: hypothetical protein ACHP7J_06720 [Terriglobales bacterium]
MVAALMAAIAASTTVAADAQPLRVTAVAGVPLPAAIRRRAADRRTVADHRTVADRRTAVDHRTVAAAVVADMGGNIALDFFPA